MCVCVYIHIYITLHSLVENLAVPREEFAADGPNPLIYDFCPTPPLCVCYIPYTSGHDNLVCRLKYTHLQIWNVDVSMHVYMCMHAFTSIYMNIYSPVGDLLLGEELAGDPNPLPRA